VITPRKTRLVRVADLRAFRAALAALAGQGPPLAARDRIIVVPSRAASEHLQRHIEDTRLNAGTAAVILPEMVPVGDLVATLARRLDDRPRVLDDTDREVLLGVACRAVQAGVAHGHANEGAPATHWNTEGVPVANTAPFRLRPGLLTEMLRFYDALRLNQKNVDAFERLALGMLEPGADSDRGAERLVRQTKFLAAAFRDFEHRCALHGVDRHGLRDRVIEQPASRPFRHLVIAVGDRAQDRHGLGPADWDLVARVPGLESLDVVATDRMVAGAFHETIHRLLPGIEEVRADDAHQGPTRPVLVAPSAGRLSRSAASPSPSPSPSLSPHGHANEGAPGDPWHTEGVPPTDTGHANEGAPGDPWNAEGVPATDTGPRATLHKFRDREEEVADFARRVKGMVRAGTLPSPSRAALVVYQRLPYVYVAREVFRAAGVPCQMFDELPLAAEPFAAALDLVLTAVASNFARGASIALLRSPHLRLGATGRVAARDIDALDRAMAEASYLGDPAALRKLAERWAQADPRDRRAERARRAVGAVLDTADALAPLNEPQPVARYLRTLMAFLAAHGVVPGPDDPLRARQLRARGAVMAMLGRLADAYGRFDDHDVSFAELRALIKRWLDAQTFAPRAGDAGVHLVDAASAPFGDFDLVQLAGLVEREWPDASRRNIFYSTAVLRELGWPAEQERLQGARAAFADLLMLPERLVVSTFQLEADTAVAVSPLVDEVRRAELDAVEEPVPARRIFDYEALALPPPRLDVFTGVAGEWASLRSGAPAVLGPEYRGQAGAFQPGPLSLSALERYLDCPFKFFASEVLRLEEPPEDDVSISPLERGRFVHEALQKFFEAWDRAGHGPITPATLSTARTVFAAAVEPLLAQLSDTDAALERTRLFGSAISPGIAETVLGLEAVRPPELVEERWLEYRLEGDFTLGDPDGRTVALRGMADRIDLLPGRRLRVVDYKSGRAPAPRTALQAPVYALCARERLEARDGAEWQIEEASYLALSGPRNHAPIVQAGTNDAMQRLSEARMKVMAVVDAVRAGDFPPRPMDEMSCRRCAYASVCRKDYVGDE
jgi:RecB family exonuclease/inactivated superfamily I helicase